MTASHVIAPYVQAAQRAVTGSGSAPPPLRVMFAELGPPPPGQPPLGESEFGVKFSFATVVAIQDGAPKLDLAALQLSMPAGRALKAAMLAGEACQEGDPVAVCGFPFGRDLHRDQLSGGVVNASFSQGIVSAILPYPSAPKVTQAVFQIDAMTNPGNSGGPVFDPNTGDILGVLIQGMLIKRAAPSQDATGPSGAEKTAKAEEALGMPTGIARAIHIHKAAPIIAALREGRTAAPPRVSR